MKNSDILQTFLKCPNCNSLKNVNYTKKTKIIKAECICGTHLNKLNKKIK